MKLSLALLSLPLFAALLPAATITPESYRYRTYYPGDYQNGNYNDASGGTLTDGLADVPVWGGVEAPAVGAVVGWNQTHARIVFEFGQTVNIDSVMIWVAAPDSAAAVTFPLGLEVSAVGSTYQKSMQVTNPGSTGRTVPILFSQLDYTGSTLQIDIYVEEAVGWLMLSEITFAGPLSSIPEPSAFAVVAGLAAIGFGVTRRRGRKA